MWLLLPSLLVISAALAGEQATIAPRLDLLVGRAWTSTAPQAAPGAVRIFLPDGTLLMTSCVETYRVSRWTRLTATRIAWDEDRVRIEAEITRVTATDLQLRLQLKGESRTESYTAATAPYTCPAIRDAPVPEIAASGLVVYLERIALPASARVRIELRDDSRGDAAKSPLAVQTLSAQDGPPFRFTVAVPRSRVDTRSRLSVFAEVTDGGRVLFTTRNRYPVPAGGATDLEVRLTFVSSARGEPAPAVVTPAPVGYRCADEVFRVAFEDGRAYVTMPDRSLVTLRRLDANPRGGARTYTDGRMTFVQELEGASGPRVRFARGRRALVSCTLVR